MRPFVVIFRFLLIALATPAFAPRFVITHAQEPLLWGSLKPGVHAVGYRTHYRLDYTRIYDPQYGGKPTPRPIFISIWYPAQATKTEPISYRQYLEVGSTDSLVAPFAKRLMPYTRDVVCEETIGKKTKAMSPAEAAAFDRLLNTKTIAVKDAPAAGGRFPVVIYHPGLGGSYEDNSVLFEYLASHGYVVISSAYSQASATTMNIDWDLKRSFRDMEFLARYACGLPNADANRLAAMGHSYGAQAALAWAAEPSSALRAAVSIDSTVENVGIDWPGFAPLKAHFEATKRNLRAPVLRFASRDNKPKFETLERYLKFAPRYEATVASLDHNDYLTHGAMRPALMPKKWPDAKKAQSLRRSYDRVCRHILNFLDAMLKEQSEARQFLKRSARGEGLDEEFKVQFRAPAPAPPTARQLILLTERQGVEKAAELIRTCRDDIEVGGNGIVGAGTVLIDDGRTKDAVALFKLAAELFPKSFAVRSNLGKTLALIGDRAAAIAEYKKCLELLPGETESEIRKAQWKKEIEKHIQELSTP